MVVALRTILFQSPSQLKPTDRWRPTSAQCPERVNLAGIRNTEGVGHVLELLCLRAVRDASRTVTISVLNELHAHTP